MNEAVIKKNKFFLYRTIVITSAITVAYLLLSYLLIGFKTDQLFLAALFNVLYYAAAATRKFITGFSIFILYWIIFDSMKAFPNYNFNSVRIESLYNAEKYFFGIHSHATVLTPNEFLLQHTHTFLDAFTGFFYLCWVPVPLLFAGYLFYKNKAQFLLFSFCFFLVNMIGFVIYYVYPAAPPWYVQQHGFEWIKNTAGNTAGLERFDQLFNVPVFKLLYAKSSNVFAAMPSLHSAYPVIVLYYGIKNKLGAVNIFFVLVMLGIWFSAIYTSHHYVLDVIAGILCAFIGILLLENVLMRNKKLVVFYNSFLSRIS
jgi:hypothetical protein